MVSEQDTMLSLPIMGNLTYREWHGFIDGFYVGLVDGEKAHDYDREKHYWRMGFVAGRASNDYI
jgi:hypothetical protein